MKQIKKRFGKFGRVWSLWSVGDGIMSRRHSTVAKYILSKGGCVGLLAILLKFHARNSFKNLFKNKVSSLVILFSNSRSGKITCLFVSSHVRNCFCETIYFIIVETVLAFFLSPLSQRSTQA